MRRLLERDAARVRSQDPRLASELAAAAQSERAAARSLLPLLTWYNPGPGDERGIVEYDRASAQQRIDDNYESELAALRSGPLAEEADRARDTSVNLFGVVALFVASLFFLTLAQLGRAVTREIYAASGMAVLLIATLLFHWVGP
jgi:hypothetical protein